MLDAEPGALEDRCVRREKSALPEMLEDESESSCFAKLVILLLDILDVCGIRDSCHGDEPYRRMKTGRMGGYRYYLHEARREAHARIVGMSNGERFGRAVVLEYATIYFSQVVFCHPDRYLEFLYVAWMRFNVLSKCYALNNGKRVQA